MAETQGMRVHSPLVLKVHFFQSHIMRGIRTKVISLAQYHSSNEEVVKFSAGIHWKGALYAMS